MVNSVGVKAVFRSELQQLKDEQHDSLNHIHYYNLNKFTFFTSPAKLQQVLLVNPNTPITRRNGFKTKASAKESQQSALFLRLGSSERSGQTSEPPSLRRQADTSFRGEGISRFHQSIKLSASTKTLRRAPRCLFSFPSFICLVKRRRLKRGRTSAEH